MTTNNQSALALRALQEIEKEKQEQLAPGQTLFPGLADVLRQIGPIPPDALLFGMASDGLPLLLNLRNANPGPLLVLADQGSGKTIFLQLLARAAKLLSPQRVRYAVLTNFPDEWDGFQSERHCIGVYRPDDEITLDLLDELASQAEAGPQPTSVILLFDGLESALRMGTVTQENLRYLLARGPQACIWPIVSLNAAYAPRFADWLSLFRMRVYGRIADPELADELTPAPGAGLKTLFSGAQFCLRQKAHWLRFWLPSL